MTDSKTIPYAVIGCGEHACRGHIDHMAGGNFRLVSVYDPDDGNAAIAMSKGINVARHDTVEQLLTNAAVKAVLIASPDRFHPEQLLACVKAGKHVLVDKPLAIDRAGMDTAIMALSIVRNEGLVVTSCHPRRFDPPYAWIKTNLECLTEKFGKPLSLHLDFSYHAPNDAWKHSRSLLLDHFPHEIDYLNYLFGHNHFVAHRLTDAYDRYSVAGSRGDGIDFFFYGTRRLTSSVYPETIAIRFERGMIKLLADTNLLMMHDHETGATEVRSAKSTDYNARFLAIAKNFERAILGEEENYLTTDDLVVNNSSAISLVENGSVTI